MRQHREESRDGRRPRVSQRAGRSAERRLLARLEWPRSTAARCSRGGISGSGRRPRGTQSGVGRFPDSRDRGGESSTDSVLRLYCRAEPRVGGRGTRCGPRSCRGRCPGTRARTAIGRAGAEKRAQAGAHVSFIDEMDRLFALDLPSVSQSAGDGAAAREALARRLPGTGLLSRRLVAVSAPLCRSTRAPARRDHANRLPHAETRRRVSSRFRRARRLPWSTSPIVLGAVTASTAATIKVSCR